jgi:hypothetical protein
MAVFFVTFGGRFFGIVAQSTIQPNCKQIDSFLVAARIKMILQAPQLDDI